MAVAIASADVAWPRTSSTSVISGTGFMKCMPSTSSGRVVAAASVVMEIDEVFDVSITPGRATASSVANSARLVSRFSNAASTT